jgi:hypothetical protein
MIDFEHPELILIPLMYRYDKEIRRYGKCRGRATVIRRHQQHRSCIRHRNYLPIRWIRVKVIGEIYPSANEAGIPTRGTLTRDRSKYHLVMLLSELDYEHSLKPKKPVSNVPRISKRIPTQN